MLDWKSDNTGPPGCDRDTEQSDDLAGNGTSICNLTAGVAQVMADYRTVRGLFPGAAVVASDLDGFMSGLSGQKHQLPIVTGELADGWIYGIASDPIKLQRMRELARARKDWLASGAADAHPATLRRFTLLSTKNSEHTWGIHNAVVTDTALTTDWDNAAFHAARLAAHNPYWAVERAWRQQRSFGLDAAGTTPAIVN